MRQFFATAAHPALGLLTPKPATSGARAWASSRYSSVVAEPITRSRGMPYVCSETGRMYRPMRELLALLEARGFTAYICSGGGRDLSPGRR